MNLTKKDVPAIGIKRLQFILDEVLPSTQKYEVLHKIGEGTFSTVYLAKLKSSSNDDELSSCDNFIAIKHLIPTSSPERIFTELDCLRLANGQNNIIPLLFAHRFGADVIIGMPYLQSPVQSFAKMLATIQVDEVIEYMWQLLTAVEYIHKLGIVHRDIKPANFLYDRTNNRYALVDFGLAQRSPDALQCQKQAFLNVLNEQANGVDCFKVEGGDEIKMKGETGDLLMDTEEVNSSISRKWRSATPSCSLRRSREITCNDFSIHKCDDECATNISADVVDYGSGLVIMRGTTPKTSTPSFSSRSQTKAPPTSTVDQHDSSVECCKRKLSSSDFLEATLEATTAVKQQITPNKNRGGSCKNRNSSNIRAIAATLKTPEKSKCPAVMSSGKGSSTSINETTSTAEPFASYYNKRGNCKRTPPKLVSARESARITRSRAAASAREAEESCLKTPEKRRSSVMGDQSAKSCSRNTFTSGFQGGAASYIFDEDISRLGVRRSPRRHSTSFNNPMGANGVGYSRLTISGSVITASVPVASSISAGRRDALRGQPTAHGSSKRHPTALRNSKGSTLSPKLSNSTNLLQQSQLNSSTSVRSFHAKTSSFTILDPTSGFLQSDQMTPKFGASVTSRHSAMTLRTPGPYPQYPSPPVLHYMFGGGLGQIQQNSFTFQPSVLTDLTSQNTNKLANVPKDMLPASHLLSQNLKQTTAKPYRGAAAVADYGTIPLQAKFAGAGATTTPQPCLCYSKCQVCSMCIQRPSQKAARAGTPGFRPPEVLLKHPYQTTSVDVWAVGVILLSILSRTYPFFRAPDDMHALAEIIALFGTDLVQKAACQYSKRLTVNCPRSSKHNKDNSSDQVCQHSADGCVDFVDLCRKLSSRCLASLPPCDLSRVKWDLLAEASVKDSKGFLLADLLTSLLKLSSTERITASQALNHRLFTLYRPNK